MFHLFWGTAGSRHRVTDVEWCLVSSEIFWVASDVYLVGLSWQYNAYHTIHPSDTSLKGWTYSKWLPVASRHWLVLADRDLNVVNFVALVVKVAVLVVTADGSFPFRRIPFRRIPFCRISICRISNRWIPNRRIPSHRTLTLTLELEFGEMEFSDLEFGELKFGELEGHRVDMSRESWLHSFWTNTMNGQSLKVIHWLSSWLASSGFRKLKSGTSLNLTKLKFKNVENLMKVW